MIRKLTNYETRTGDQVPLLSKVQQSLVVLIRGQKFLAEPSTGDNQAFQLLAVLSASQYRTLSWK